MCSPTCGNPQLQLITVDGCITNNIFSVIDTSNFWVVGRKLRVSPLFFIVVFSVCCFQINVTDKGNTELTSLATLSDAPQEIITFRMSQLVNEKSACNCFSLVLFSMCMKCTNLTPGRLGFSSWLWFGSVNKSSVVKAQLNALCLMLWGTWIIQVCDLFPTKRPMSAQT